MMLLSVWLCLHDYRKYHGFTLNQDTLGSWFGLPFFTWLTLSAWTLHWRVNWPRN